LSDAIISSSEKSCPTYCADCRRKKEANEYAGRENAGLENKGTSFVWIARSNIINVVPGCVRVVLKGMDG